MSAVELAQHLRYCMRCHDTDVVGCQTGSRLWREVVGGSEVPYPLPRDVGDLGGDDLTAARYPSCL